MITLEDSAAKKAAYNKRYNRENTVTVLVRINKNTEADVIDFLEKVKKAGGSKSGYMKMLIKMHIEEGGGHFIERFLKNH